MESVQWRPWGTYEDLVASLQILRARTDTRALVDFVLYVAEKVSEAQVRRMILRLVRRGVILREGTGRAGYCTLSKEAEASGIVALKKQKSDESWDRNWTVFSYDVPVSKNAARHRLARLLHQMGFAMLSASSWVSPYDWQEVLQQQAASCGAGRFTYVRAGYVCDLAHPDEPWTSNLWDIEKVSAEYSRIIAMCGQILEKGAHVGPQERARIAVAATKALANTEEVDPMLPIALLPAVWPRHRALQSVGLVQERVRRDILAAGPLCQH